MLLNPHVIPASFSLISSYVMPFTRELIPLRFPLHGRLAGSNGAFRKENIHSRTAEIGYYIAEKDWGRGIGSDAVKRLCRYLFQNTDLLRIFAEPFAYNQASCRILEKAGFALEGVLRKNAVKNGKILDMKMYSIVRE